MLQPLQYSGPTYGRSQVLLLKGTSTAGRVQKERIRSEIKFEIQSWIHDKLKTFVHLRGQLTNYTISSALSCTSAQIKHCTAHKDTKYSPRFKGTKDC